MKQTSLVVVAFLMAGTAMALPDPIQDIAKLVYGIGDRVWDRVSLLRPSQARPSQARPSNTGPPSPGDVTPVMVHDVSGCDDKEVLIITVDYAPGGADPAHRHWAQAFVYVLEGSITMQVEGGEQVTIGKGQTFYEARPDVHIVGKNASDKDSAKFLVVLVKNKNVAPVLPPDAQDPSLSA